MSPFASAGRRGLVAGLALAGALAAAAAPDWRPGLPLQASQYAHSSWTARDGASVGLVFAIAQTPDGYLWAGGSFGLFRFDGLRFTRWEPPGGATLQSRPYSLLVSRDGTLWIGTFSGLSSWNGREFKQYPATNGEFVTSLLEDREGTVWAGTLGKPGKLCAVRRAEAQCSTPEGGFGLFVWSLAEDGQGTLWVGADSGLWRWKPGAPRRIELPGMRVGDLATTAEGQLLVSIRGGGLRRVEGERLVPYPVQRAFGPEAPLAEREIRSNKLLRDGRGGLWIGTDDRGILHLQQGRADAFTRGEGLTGNIACSLFEDREGNIWFGSEKGLDRFSTQAVTTLAVPQGLPDEATQSVLATRDGSVWVATHDGLARWKHASPVVYREREGLPGAKVQSMYEDAGGRLWVATGRGLAYLDASERFVAVPGVPGKEFYSITGDAAGHLWLSDDEGLTRLADGRLAENIPWRALGRHQQAKMVLADTDGGVWLAFWDDGGVLYFKDGRIQADFGVAQGLGAGHVAHLRQDAEGAVWASTEDGGLSRIHAGRVSTLTSDNGMPCNTVHWSTLDDTGALWLYTACGLLKLARDELAAWIAEPARRMAFQRWDAGDGVPLHALSQAFFNPPVAKAADGRLWFVTGAGVQVVDPAHLPFNRLPPPVHIEALVADQQRHAPRPGLSLPPRVRDIALEFAALSLVEPRSTRFRYRLEGYDKDWRDLVGARQAAYTNLPPGHYRFQVKAANNSGVWNEQGAQLEFTIEPAFYQTAWFRVALTLLLGGLAWAGLRFWLRRRLRRLHREFEATLEARVAERTRIARDLHDTLLQRFHGLLLQSQAALNLLPDRASESKRVLAAAIDRAAEAITEGRDTVQGLRSATQDGDDLAEALRALVNDLAAENGAPAAAQVEVQNPPRTLHPLVRDETFRIAAEALRNAYRHAAAQHIRVEIRYDPRQLRVQVQDDGKGIEPEVLGAGRKPGHFGLSGMHERAALAGGQLAVRRGREGGTTVEFSAPGSRAYLRAPGPRLLPRRIASSEAGE